MLKMLTIYNKKTTKRKEKEKRRKRRNVNTHGPKGAK
jgi:hypothetical protein